MKKILVEYDETTGQLKDAKGDFIGTWMGVVSFELVEGAVPVDTLVKLKNAGYEANEVIELKRKGVI